MGLLISSMNYLNLLSNLTTILLSY